MELAEIFKWLAIGTLTLWFIFLVATEHIRNKQYAAQTEWKLENYKRLHKAINDKFSH